MSQLLRAGYILSALRRQHQPRSDHTVKNERAADGSPDYTWVCQQLLELLSQYPGGLSMPVILTNLATKHQAASTPVVSKSWTSVVVTGVQCLSAPGPPSSDGSYRGGTWVLHLKDEHSSKPLQLYASSSFAPLLSNSQSDPAAQQQQQAGQPAHTLVGTRLRLPGALAQPQRVVGRSRHGPQTATRPYLPTRAIMIEVDESDSGVWARNELSNHPTLGRAEFSRVFDLEQSQQVVSAIATQVRACIDGWLAVVVADDSHHAQQQAVDAINRQQSVSIQLRGRGCAPAAGQGAPASSTCTTLYLEGETAALAQMLQAGDEMLLYCAVICRGRGGLSATLELGHETIVVLKSTATQPSKQGGAQEQAGSSDISAQHDQRPGYAAHAAGTGMASSSAGDAPLALAQCRAGVAGGVVWAAVLKVIKVNRRAGEQLQALVVLDDGSTQWPALVELGDRRRALQQLVEGHVLLLVGAQAVLVSQLSPQQQKLAMFAFTGDAKQAAPTTGDGSQEILLWRESAQASLYDVSALPGILNSPALHQRLSLHEAAAAAEALAQRRADAVQGQACAGGPAQAPPTLCTGAMPGSFVCCVHLAEADIDTQRVHMYCGRPVAASCFDMGDEDEDEEMTDAQAPAEQPAAQTGAGAQGCAPAAAVNAEVKPAEPDMSLDGLWECSFCNTVCSSSDVGFDFCGHLTLQQHSGPPHPQPPAQAHSCLPETGVRPGSRIGGPPDQQVWRLGADAAALAVVAGTSAEAWRLQGQTAASTQLARKLSEQEYVASLVVAPPAAGQGPLLHIAMLQPLLA